MLGNRADADDIAQEAFLRLWRMLPDWKPGRAKLSTWIYRVTTNLCVDRMRRPREAALPDGFGMADPSDGVEAAMVQAEASDEIHAAIGALPERQRAALVLVHFEGCSNLETASILDISVEAVESLLARARRTLRGALSEMETGGADAGWRSE